jgi:hypothetical protein
LLLVEGESARNSQGIKENKETQAMKTYRLKASSIQNYEMIVKAENEDAAYEYASLNSGSWKEITSDDWQDEGCEEVMEGIQND